MAGDPFPSLIIDATGFAAQGAFAESQAEFLDPDPDAVSRLGQALRASNTGVVAHFYMDAELQGALYAAAADWPHVHVSDSLMMADAAITMAEAGVRNVTVLGVDFMSENVRAMLDAAGHREVGVYRVSTDPIGCSLAESAEGRAYAAYLARAAEVPHALHVVYINTSLRTKAQAHHRVPTVTCTSSNVVRTVLQAFAQDPEVQIFFGPDTYMGENLANMFRHLAQLDDAAIRAVHPDHDRASMARVVEQFQYFEQGNCVVHHMFGGDVVEQVRADYGDAYVTAHLEVPGEMFALGLEAQQAGRGVVGSTSNILNFITDRVGAQIERGEARRLSFVLGTEAGMVTAIVREIRGMLAEAPDAGVEVEVVFPVASEAVAATGDVDLPLIPGVQGGEGCSTAGGCATCPYMKMNSLDAMMDVLAELGRDAVHLDIVAAYEPRKYQELVGGRTMADLGGEPILHMRAFQREGRLPSALMAAVAGA